MNEALVGVFSNRGAVGTTVDSSAIDSEVDCGRSDDVVTTISEITRLTRDSAVKWSEASLG